jgi:NAD(P)-dependent dehydrogenase (short-subunit alcohol dehydrogenase family)
MIVLTQLRRCGQPDDAATFVVFLAAEDSRWITGAKHSTFLAK